MVTRARDAGPLAREIEHTADLGFEVDAPTLTELFERAGLALLGMMIDLARLEPAERIELAVEADDVEMLLHDWLQDLLVRFQTQGFAACEIALAAVSDRRLVGNAAGRRIDPLRDALYTEIRGVTYHQLAVRPTADGWWARVILDV
jgi:SHS2 domain-containing protein